MSTEEERHEGSNVQFHFEFSERDNCLDENSEVLQIVDIDLIVSATNATVFTRTSMESLRRIGQLFRTPCIDFAYFASSVFETRHTSSREEPYAKEHAKLPCRSHLIAYLVHCPLASLADRNESYHCRSIFRSEPTQYTRYIMSVRDACSTYARTDSQCLFVSNRLASGNEKGILFLNRDR